LGHSTTMKFKHAFLFFVAIALSVDSAEAVAIFKPWTWFCNEALTAPANIGDQQAVRNMIEHQNFEIARDFDQYVEKFGETFLPFLREQAQPGDTWIDMGAGLALAQIEFTRMTRSTYRELNLISTGYVRPTVQNMTTGKSYESQHRYLRLVEQLEAHLAPSGRIRYVEGDIALKQTQSFAQAGSVRLITDLFGPISYVDDLTHTLKIYGQLLMPGGRLYLVKNNLRLVIKDSRAKHLMTIGGFIRSHCRGFRVVRSEPNYYIERTDQPLVIPELTLKEVRMADKPPPYRRFSF
jgi:SAM-dependent methyltransferase